MPCGMCHKFVSAIHIQRLISTIKILRQSRRVVWCAGENDGVLVEENIGESLLGSAAGTSIRDKKKH